MARRRVGGGTSEVGGGNGEARGRRRQRGRTYGGSGKMRVNGGNGEAWIGGGDARGRLGSLPSFPDPAGGRPGERGGGCRDVVPRPPLLDLAGGRPGERAAAAVRERGGSGARGHGGDPAVLPSASLPRYEAHTIENTTIGEGEEEHDVRQPPQGGLRTLRLHQQPRRYESTSCARIGGGSRAGGIEILIV
ncbi:hypothetical protein [Oryza sativa Japonica Group]|uniref:Uncharacterized protein n=1 Tax=Oryza sativa subsp. japonica TaxID=39947 RepID=Q5N7Y2_ORYSJ|nr:hypothetical protein [Oryza sativa Japonica Group]BAD82424.1 hypothetical protein [Oryza sativa Japonica Group]